MDCISKADPKCGSPYVSPPSWQICPLSGQTPAFVPTSPYSTARAPEEMKKIYQFSFDNIYFSYLTNSSLGLSVCFDANCNCLCTFAQSLCLFVTCCRVINGSNSGWCSAETIYRGVHKSCQRGSINPRRKYVDTTLCWDINHKTRCHITASWRKH